MLLTDIHCHVLPGIDDGAGDGRVSMAMLRSAYREGVRRIIATPHYRRGMFETPEELIEKRYLQVKQRAKQIGTQGIEVYLGCEYYRHTGMADRLKEGRRPTMAGSRYVLTEFSGMDSYSRIRTTVYELRNAGYIPVIAHAERYQALKEHVENIEDLIELGAMIQLNADSVLGNHGRKTKQFCKKLMKKKMVHFIASDAHDRRERPSRLRECADYVEKKWGHETARRIFEKNPSKIIGEDWR